MPKHLTVKELPEYERPYEKCRAKGASSLSDAELISAIIRTGSVGEKSIDLADRVLSADSHGLLNLVYLDVEELMKIRGIGTVKAVQLKCAAELAKRLSMACRREDVCLNNPASIASYYMERLRHEQRETLLLTMYNASNLLLGDEILSVGTSNASLVSPVEIFRTALKKHAEYIVLLHNHPSGDPEPSSEDILITERVKQCGELMGIPLMDHVIIGDNRYFSFREQEIM